MHEVRKINFCKHTCAVHYGNFLLLFYTGGSTHFSGLLAKDGRLIAIGIRAILDSLIVCHLKHELNGGCFSFATELSSPHPLPQHCLL